MTNGWMVRAGRSGIYFDDFAEGVVAVGWSAMGDLNAYQSVDVLKEKYTEIYGNEKPAKTGNAIAMILKFRDQITEGDCVVTYSPKSREYLVGRDLGEYFHQPEAIGNYANLRKVEWLGRVKRDLLTEKSRRSLSSTLTLFALKDPVVEELLSVLKN